jgi:hypothetical protein
MRGWLPMYGYMSPALIARIFGRRMTRDEAFDRYVKSPEFLAASPGEPESPQRPPKPTLLRAPHSLAREHEQPAQAGSGRHARTASLS